MPQPQVQAKQGVTSSRQIVCTAVWEVAPCRVPPRQPALHDLNLLTPASQAAINPLAIAAVAQELAACLLRCALCCLPPCSSLPRVTLRVSQCWSPCRWLTSCSRLPALLLLLLLLTAASPVLRSGTPPSR